MIFQLVSGEDSGCETGSGLLAQRWLFQPVWWSIYIITLMPAQGSSGEKRGSCCRTGRQRTAGTRLGEWSHPNDLKCDQHELCPEPPYLPQSLVCAPHPTLESKKDLGKAQASALQRWGNNLGQLGTTEIPCRD